ncbi:hypothetical protein [Dokdonella sp.]|uniref:hypothetical protein n=1 Tax=Dokdonella sp. TaxID=2291710 RepID=UPI0031BF1678|nr:hypothetical protein [Dokdonella sp.]
MQMPRSKFLTIAFALAAAVALTACGKKEEPAPAPEAPAQTAPAPAPVAPAPAPEPVTVTSVELGSAVGPDQKITTPATTFKPDDTIYAAVSTTGTSDHAVLQARWTYEDGQTVNESTQTIAPQGPAVTSFHISKPDGWPEGHYKVEILLDEQPAMSKDFSVAK